MRKTLTALAAAGCIAAASFAPTPAEARRGGAVAAGIIGGLALGAIAGGALAAPRHHYAPRYYEPAPVYYYRRPACRWERERIWDGYGWIIRRVRVCY